MLPLAATALADSAVVGMAAALSVDVSHISKKVKLLDGICDEAAELLKDHTGLHPVDEGVGRHSSSTLPISESTMYGCSPKSAFDDHSRTNARYCSTSGLRSIRRTKY